MQITIFGAAGNAGRRIVKEALSRGHEVTAVLRDPGRGSEFPGGINTRVGNAANPNDVERLCQDQDVVISATRSATSDVQEMRTMARVLLEGTARSGTRLLIVGGAASLLVPGTDGRLVLDDPRFLGPSDRHIGEASLAQYQQCLSANRTNWTYLCPPAELVPGDRTGRYRLGLDELLIDAAGISRISIEDLAVALLDEAEYARHHQRRFTAAY